MYPLFCCCMYVFCMYFLHCKLCLCTPYLPLSLCPFFVPYVFNHPLCICVCSFTNCRPMSLPVSSQYTRPWRLSFFFPSGCECRSRRRPNTVSAVDCCQARPRPLPVSAMLQANLFYTSFYRTVTSCLASSVFRRGYSRGSCRGHARSCCRRCLDSASLVHIVRLGARLEAVALLLADLRRLPSLPDLALPCLVRRDDFLSFLHTLP